MKKILEILNDIFITFGIVMLVLLVIAVAIGNDARGMSSLFEFGASAISVPAILQILILCAGSNILKHIFYSDFMIKHLPRWSRILILFVVVYILLVFEILHFGWIGESNSRGWIFTSLAFVLSFTGSVVAITLKENAENKKMNDALSQYK